PVRRCVAHPLRLRSERGRFDESGAHHSRRRLRSDGGGAAARGSRARAGSLARRAGHRARDDVRAVEHHVLHADRASDLEPLGILYTAYFTGLQLRSGLAWTPHVWVGVVAFAAVIGWLMSYLIVPPRVAPALTDSSATPRG